MSLARANELNNFPGRKLLLELASELELSNAQAMRIEEIRLNMKSQAVANGLGTFAPDCHLADLLASGRPSVTEARRMTRRSGVMRTLQGIRLLAHMGSSGDVTGDQIKGLRPAERLRAWRAGARFSDA